MKATNRLSTKIKPGQSLKLANGIILKNPSNVGVRLLIETPIALNEKSEAVSHEIKSTPQS